MSPSKKKPRIVEYLPPKRANDYEDSNNKRRKTDTVSTDVSSLKRRNFVKACEKVSCKAYIDYVERIQLIYLPCCIRNSSCKHNDYNETFKLKQTPPFAEESFKIEMTSNMWCEALEVCRLCLTPTQYLSSNILKNIVEIILNAHEDDCVEYPVMSIISQCQQILALNFSTHPPCFIKSVRKCYNTFLTSPMDMKENTFTNRSEFECEKGIVKYCMNRLEYEISAESKDEALVDKNENIPEEMKQSVKGLHWQKEKMEIFELLNRTDRIERIMAVLHSIIELLQFDLAIWHSRYTNNLGCHIMRSHKPLMAYILWSNNVLYTGAVNNNCRQILTIFTYFIHLNYPEEHIKTMQLWLNTMIQTFYICENNSNSDYPNTGKYCTVFAKEFYKIISDMPNESRIRILEKIHPTFMQHLIGLLHIKSFLSTDEDNIIIIVLNVINNCKWNMFPKNNNKIVVKKIDNVNNIKHNKFLKYLSKKCKSDKLKSKQNLKQFNVYSKYTPCKCESEVDQNDFMHVLYITFRAYFDAYSVQDVKETLDMLNNKLHDTDDENSPTEYNSYTVTENFIKKYRGIYQHLKELIIILHKLRNMGQLPEVLKVFDNITLLSS